MENNKQMPLSGANNKRLKMHRPTNSGQNAPILNTEDQALESQVSIPSLSDVEEAKDWVDNGSRL